LATHALLKYLKEDVPKIPTIVGSFALAVVIKKHGIQLTADLWETVCNNLRIDVKNKSATKTVCDMLTAASEKTK